MTASRSTRRRHPPPLRSIVLLGLACALFRPPPLAAATPLRVVPAPRRVELGAGEFSLRKAVSIAVSDDADDRFAAEILRDEIVAVGGAQAEIVTGGRGDIVLTRAGAPAEVGEEGHRIEVRPDGVRIAAKTAAGLFYGVQTLRQMIEPGGSRQPW